MMKLFQPLRNLMPFLVGYDKLQANDFVAPNVYRKHFCNFTSLLGCVVLMSSTIIVGCFLVFEAETFEEFSGHFYEFATGLNDTFYFISMDLICKHILELNDKYEEIIEKRSTNEKKHKLYGKARDIVELTSKYILNGYLKVVLPFATIPYLFKSYFNYYTTDLKDAFILPFVFWTIFDWRTPTMYIIVFTFELTATAYMAMVASILLVHSFGSCWLFMTFVDDITADVIVLNAYKRKKGSAVQLYEQLKEFIRFHSEIKQLLTKAGNTYSLIFTSNLLWTVSTLAVLLVTLQMELTRSELDLPAILKLICLTLSVLFPLLGICSGCEEAKRRFDDLDIYQRCRWYRYPLKIQHAITITICGSQDLEPFKMFGSLTASRETCKKVIKGAFSTFMVLRSFLK